MDMITKSNRRGVIVDIGALFFLLLVFTIVNCGVSVRTHRSEGPRPDVDERLKAIDKILESLEIGKIAFNAPKQMNLHDTSVIQLLLGVEKSIDELRQRLREEGEVEVANIQVSESMEARLSGQNFFIGAITPEIQVVSRSNITEWKWEVKPRSDGCQRLHLTLSVRLSINGETKARVIRTFDKVIDVEVTWPQRIASFFKNNWQWLWIAILVPLAGWLWNRRRHR